MASLGVTGNPKVGCHNRAIEVFGGKTSANDPLWDICMNVVGEASNGLVDMIQMNTAVTRDAVHRKGFVTVHAIIVNTTCLASSWTTLV